MSTGAIPPLPQGYTLDQQSSIPPLPAGYKLDSPPANEGRSTSLDTLANSRSNIPLDSYTDATLHGLDTIGQGIYQAADAIAHPIRTAQGIYQTAKSALNPFEVANALDKLKNVSPLDVSDFAGNQAGQILAGLGTEAALRPVAGAIKSGAQRTVLLGKTPDAAYESALKPSTTIPEAKRAAIVQTGLQEGIPVSKNGLKLLDERLSALQDAVTEKINAGAGQGVTVDPRKVAARLPNVASRFAEQVNPEADLSAIKSARDEFLNNNPQPLSATAAQKMKVGTYQQLSSKAYGEVGTATQEAQKALARGIKEELAAQIPEISKLNAMESKLYDLQPVLERAVNRIANHQLIGIGTPITTGAVKAVTGSGKLAAVAGMMKAVLDDPLVKSRLAIAISKGSNVPLAVASGRIATYQSALSAAARNQDQSQP